MKANIYMVSELPNESYPFKTGDHVLIIEIKNMPGHCAVIDGEGKIHWAYHTEHFTKLTEDET